MRFSWRNRTDARPDHDEWEAADGMVVARKGANSRRTAPALDLADLSHQHSTLWIARKLADDKGVGVLVVLHDLNLAALYADRIAITQDGQLKSLGHPAEVLQAHILEEVFGIPVTISPHPVRQDRPLVVTSPAIHQSSIFWDTR